MKLKMNYRIIASDENTELTRKLAIIYQKY